MFVDVESYSTIIKIVCLYTETVFYPAYVRLISILIFHQGVPMIFYRIDYFTLRTYKVITKTNVFVTCIELIVFLCYKKERKGRNSGENNTLHALRSKQETLHS